MAPLDVLLLSVAAQRHAGKAGLPYRTSQVVYAFEPTGVVEARPLAFKSADLPQRQTRFRQRWCQR